ncbi:MAG: minichromosome maintenance protein 5 [Chaenotheca gracillima]|nr:MAG: minichromosome maintenance protein 5 [Chaenotheca gracillima]
MAPPYIITVIGSLNTDLVTRTARVPEAGETLMGQSFSTGSGGKGANQAVACARLSRGKPDVNPSKKRRIEGDGASSGVDASQTPDQDVIVKMIGAVGTDEFGKPLVDGLKEDGIDTSGVLFSEEARTGVACIFVEEATGENRILFTPGANFTWKPEHFDELAAPLPHLIVLQLEIPLETVLRITEVAKTKGVPVLLNPAPAMPLPEKAYEAITHLIVNRSEAGVLAGIPEDEVVGDRIGSIATSFIDKGVQNVIITLGAQGAFFKQSNGTTGHCAAEKVSVVDTTAAGDTFAGAYAVEAAKATDGNFDIKRAVQRASQAAALTVQRQGAQSSIPWLDDVTFSN